MQAIIIMMTFIGLDSPWWDEKREKEVPMENEQGGEEETLSTRIINGGSINGRA